MKFRHKSCVPMTGVNRDVPSKIVVFSGPYRAEAQGVALPQHEQSKPRPILSLLAATIGRLGQFLAGQRI